MTLDHADLRRMYRTMLLIRRFEEQAVAFFMSGELRGSLHPCIGQEATAVGAVFPLRTDDYLTCTYRGHGQAIAKGLDPKEGMAELLGRRTGCSQGKGGSMHYTDLSVGLLGENAIVGAGAPIAVGAALRAKLDKTGQVAMSIFGDGAINQGALLEAFNLAAAWQAPVIFLCENNLYSEMTPISSMVGTATLAERAAGFGWTTMTVDGYDPIAVYETTSQAVEHARNGGGPVFIEAMTYRLFGHMVGDTEPYRTKEEVAQWRAKDPITIFPQRLIDDFGFKEAEIGAVKAEVEAEIEEIKRFALESPWPDVSEIAEHMFA
ncbi:MAG TPA: thiamine pyrophosphate-dependent dehydrogenase E1 component subunit alpha [Anaerolineae bacterium]|nr:thiamine pyrophosphate-dependent dehydrogenase E1 component subunit alpha [Anaerolineae bacterium]